VVDAQAQVAVIGGLRDRLSGGFAVPAGPDVALGAVPGAVGAALGLGRGRRCAGASGGMLACLSTVERDHEQRVGRGQDDVLGLGAGLLQPCSVEIGDAVLGELVVLDLG